MIHHFHFGVTHRNLPQHRPLLNIGYYCFKVCNIPLIIAFIIHTLGFPD